MRKLIVQLLPWLPRRLRTAVARRLLGWEIHPTARLGRSVVDVRRLTMGPGAAIGPRNLITGLEELTMGPESRIGGGNRIVGFFDGMAMFHGDHPRRSALLMGAYAIITTDHKIDCSDTVELEPYAVLGGFGCVVLTHSLDLRTNGWRIAPLRIGDHSIVLSGCTMFVGASVAPRVIVAAGSVIAAPLEQEATLYQGNPAVAVRELDLSEYAFLTRPGHYGEGDLPA
jgi:acetyltransferase-like isoleucine patch superfamily enzyme